MIRIEGVSRQFADGGYALRDVSLQIPDKEFVAIVGPSGCGKSTLLRIMAGLEDKTAGVVEAPTKLAMVFQSGALLPWKSALDNAAFGLAMHSIKTSRKLAREKLHEVGLAGYEDRLPRNLSGGQKQRVGIARALAVGPEVLLLDEPFSALDSFTTRNLHLDLLKIWQANEMTVVLVSHSIEEAVELADRVVVMHEGKIIKTVAVDMPRPRKRERIFGLVEEIEKLLTA